MSNIKCLYITYINLNSLSSGSSVRPAKIFQALMDFGIEVKLLSGSPKDFKMRTSHIKEILKWLEKERPDFCYIEPSSIPMINHYDIKLLKQLGKLKIPTAYYARDIFWRFKDMNSNKNLTDIVKRKIIYLLFRRDFYVLDKMLNVIYTPTEAMLPYLPINCTKKTLPPGCSLTDIKIKTKVNPNKLTGIYIGGLSTAYGVDILLKSIKGINDSGYSFHLFLICRKPEWDAFKKEYSINEIPSWLEVLHISGEEKLREYYSYSDVAFCPHRISEYTDFAIPIKMMEYISFLKPIIASQTKTMERIIEKYNIGLLTDASSDSISSAIKEIYDNKKLLKKFSENCETARSDNLWKKRVTQILNDLDIH